MPALPGTAQGREHAATSLRRQQRSLRRRAAARQPLVLHAHAFLTTQARPPCFFSVYRRPTSGIEAPALFEQCGLRERIPEARPGLREHCTQARGATGSVCRLAGRSGARSEDCILRCHARGGQCSRHWCGPAQLPASPQAPGAVTGVLGLGSQPHGAREPRSSVTHALALSLSLPSACSLAQRVVLRAWQLATAQRLCSHKAAWVGLSWRLPIPSLLCQA